MSISNRNLPKINRLPSTGKEDICSAYIIEQKRIKALMFSKGVSFAQARSVVDKDLDDKVIKPTNKYKEDA
jgi:hypothetical protein